MLDFEAIKQGFEKKYFIPSHIKFNYDSCKYETKYDGELFEKLAVQTNNMFSIWRDACMYTSSLRAKNSLSEQ
ncbi:TPA: hypothetical protein NKX82_003934 [Vibrio parahaemolyticus]|nr:hypothetical protein [Vibrio parahaemolyticus]